MLDTRTHRMRVHTHARRSPRNKGGGRRRSGEEEDYLRIDAYDE